MLSDCHTCIMQIKHYTWWILARTSPSNDIYKSPKELCTYNVYFVKYTICLSSWSAWELYYYCKASCGYIYLLGNILSHYILSESLLYILQYIQIQAHNQTFLERGSKSDMVAQTIMKLGGFDCEVLCKVQSAC